MRRPSACFYGWPLLESTALWIQYPPNGSKSYGSHGSRILRISPHWYTLFVNASLEKVVTVLSGMRG